MDDRTKSIYWDIGLTLFFILAFIATYLYFTSTGLRNVMELQIGGIIPAILLFFAIYFFATLLNEIFSRE